MTRRLRWLLIVAVPLAPALAQGARTGALTGRVTDSRSGVALPATELVIASLQRRTVTDSGGEYQFSELPGGTHSIQVRRLGYQLFTQDVSVIMGAEADANFRLVRVVTLDTVQTKAAATKYTSPGLRGFEERRKIGIGNFIDEAALRKNDNRTLGNVLKRISGIRVFAYQSGEFVANSRRSGAGQAGSLTAGGRAEPRADPSKRDSPRGCWVSVYLDGIAIFQGSPDPAPDLGRVLVRELAAVEYYQGTASMPAQFATIRPTDCGVLLLWTRER